MNALLEAADRWLVRGFDPLTLSPTGTLTLPGAAWRVTFAPGGEEAYALAASGATLLRLDLAAGNVTPLAGVPRRAVTLAVTDERVYVPDPFGSEVWALDRDSGRLLQAIPVGRGPTGIALGP
jgi:DNA-binding beta-propeller fold protein YncE